MTRPLLSSMTNGSIRVEYSGGIATVTLDRPSCKNAITFAMWQDLRSIFDQLGSDGDVRVVVLTGAGDAFCSGADIRDTGYGGDPSPTAVIQRMQLINSAAIGLHRLAKPTIASVNGVAVGAGWSLALGCDIVLAAESARFAAMFIDRGISLDAGGTWLFAQHAGLQMAKHLAFTGEFITARRAADLGLVLQVHPDDELADATAAYAASLVRRPSAAMAQIKSGLNQAAVWTFEEACAFEGHAQAACVAARIVKRKRRKAAGDSS